MRIHNINKDDILYDNSVSVLVKIANNDIPYVNDFYLLDKIANQVVDMITFRLSNEVINNSAEFSLNVLKKYNDYCDHLLGSGEGINALFNTVYYTHAFEFETRENLQHMINMLTLQTGVYSAFTANIIASSEDISKDERGAFTKKMCETLDKLADYKKTAITGEDRYCYLTNSVIDYGTLHLSSESSVDWKTVMANKTYVDCHGGSINAQVYDSSHNNQNISRLIGDASAMLIYYTVAGNKETFNHDYMNRHLAKNAQSNNNGVVVSYQGVKTMPQDTDLRLSSSNVIGNYFENDPDVYLRSLPKKAEFGYVNIHQMATGTLFIGTPASSQYNTPLLANVVYGENHARWFVDESAMMYGPKDTGRSDYNVRRETTYEDTFMTYYTTRLSESIDYNTLLSLDLKNNPAKNDDTPLYNYYKDIEDATVEKDIKHEHDWDDGRITRQASDSVPGVIEYTCRTNSAHSYTKLFSNKETATLTFDLDGGRLPGFDNKLVREFDIGTEIILPSFAEKDGYTFQYWSENGHPADSDYIVTGNRTFKAVWVANKEYQLDKKSDLEWYKESHSIPYIRISRVENSDATLSHFRGVRIDGALINSSEYEVASGSLILKLGTNLLRILPTGDHLLEVLFDDGKVEFKLNIKKGVDTKKEYKMPVTGIE